MPNPHAGDVGEEDAGRLVVYHVRKADADASPADVLDRNRRKLGLCRVCGGNANGLDDVEVTPIPLPCGPGSGDPWALVQESIKGMGPGVLVWETARPGVELPEKLQELLETGDGRAVDDRLAGLVGDDLDDVYASVREDVVRAMASLEADEGDSPSAGPDYDTLRRRLAEADDGQKRLVLREVLRAHCVNGTLNGACPALLLATRSNTDLQIIRDLGQGRNAAFYVVSARVRAGPPRRTSPARDPARGWPTGTHED